MGARRNADAMSPFGGFEGGLQNKISLFLILRGKGRYVNITQTLRKSYLESPEKGRKRDVLKVIDPHPLPSPSPLFGAFSMSPRGLASLLDCLPRGPMGM